MEARINFIFIFSLIISFVNGQSFSNKTNAISLDYTKPMIATVIPTIVWTTPRIETSVSGVESMMIEANINSEIPLKSVKLIITSEGQNREKKIVIKENERTVSIKQVIKFLNGKNDVRLVAENVNGGKVSSSRSILIGKDELADAIDANRKVYALIFATNNYENGDDLINPVNDGQVLESILKGKYGFQTEVVLNASLEEITSKLYDYNIKKFNPQDQLFVFFAGTWILR